MQGRRVIPVYVRIKPTNVTYSGEGEPLAYHSINQALELTRGLGMDFSVITNAQALKGEAANALKDAKGIRVSFDSANRKTYESMRGVITYDKVVENIASFVGMKSADCTLGINCVVSVQNAQEIYEICQLAKELGADNIKLAPIRVKENMAAYHKTIRESVCGQIMKAKRLLEDKAFRIVDNYANNIELWKGRAYKKEYDACYIQKLFAVIGADSKIYRCHQRAYMKSEEIGDLSKRSFKDIWYSQETTDSVRNFNPQNE